MINAQQHYLAIDIETCGPNHPIFAIGVVFFKIDNRQMMNLEERVFSFAPKQPFAQQVETEDYEIVERSNYGDFDIDTWDKFWIRHKETLDYISSIANYETEIQLIDEFYSWYLSKTREYHNLRIVSDNPHFDVGYLDTRIALHRKGKTAKPLAYQWRGKHWYYVKPIDQNSIEWVISQGENGKQCLSSIYQLCPLKPDHNPINDAKVIGWKFTQLMGYLS